MTEQTHKKYDLPTPGRTMVPEFTLKWEEVLTDPGVLNPSLSRSCTLDSRKNSTECKSQGFLEPVESGISFWGTEVPRVNSSWQQLTSLGWRMAPSLTVWAESYLRDGSRLSPLLFRWGNLDPDRVKGLSKVTQLVNDTVGSRTGELTFTSLTTASV